MKSPLLIALLFLTSKTYGQELQKPTITQLNYNKQKLVSHEIGGGRFGDQLLGYIHAKWISYYYGIPLLCNPFLYSDQLVLHNEELQATGDTAHTLKFLKACNTRDLIITVLDKNNSIRTYHPTRFHILQTMKDMDVDYTAEEKVLYWISYFPVSEKELSENTDWYYFPIDWNDEGFKKKLKRLIRPLYLSPSLSLPDDRISIAVHVRRGGGFDNPNAHLVCPTKFPPDSYYIEQIRRISDLFPGKPLYAHIFTDDPIPIKIVQMYNQHLTDLDIQFGCRELDNHHASNVLVDFFEMMRFDCLIASDSNYSIIPSKIVDYKVCTIPRNFEKIGSTIHINDVLIIKK